MASPEPSPPLSLLTLPTEMQDAIFTHLRFFDLHTLRLTSRDFHALIPPPTHGELLSAESLELGFLACAGCMRLRRIAKFSPKMFKRKKTAGGIEAYNRFCFECGRRPPPGEHRYMLGARWEENGVPFVRCLRCEKVDIGPAEQAISLCLPCHRQDLERKKAVEELKRVQMDRKSREVRRLLRAERRRKWVERGYALSDFSSVDSSDEDDSGDEWGHDGDMDYSGHS
ncbi:hypothetical protein V493_02917 [Pseudogymnoascus sp. VKM F-4281 (FW-2241)]|nr:hypothetical protein V493_02917 [Pseudogymnoascus sp. VKM F-4281 (FW-2241)]